MSGLFHIRALADTHSDQQTEICCKSLLMSENAKTAFLLTGIGGIVENFAENVMPSAERFMAKDVCYIPYKKSKEVVSMMR